MSRASHAPFLSKREAQEALTDDQILILGEALEDDGQESEDAYDSLSESDETDPQISAQIEFPVPQGPDKETIVEQQCSNPTLSKVARWVKQQHKPSSLLPMRSFILIVLSTSN